MKSKKHEIRSAIQRYFKAIDVVWIEGLIGYVCEESKIPFKVVMDADNKFVKKYIVDDRESILRYLRDLKSEGKINYEYLGEGKYKVK